MNSPNFEQARQYAEKRLEQELSPNLFYHGVGHTREEVVPAAERLARLEGVNGESLFLLLTAAWFHDIGYIHQAMGHEAVSTRIAQEVLPSFGYGQPQVEIVRGVIMATQLPQSPRDLLEQIMADADLDVLGRDTLMQRNQDLRRELACFGKEYTDPQWYASQLKFLEGHTYFTASARSLRDGRKALNMVDLRKALEELASRD